jgi:glycosyltransferase involved in cell wall biosynthesis
VCTLIENEDLRRRMGKASLQEVEQYRIEKIAKQWMVLFNELAREKHKNYDSFQ